MAQPVGDRCLLGDNAVVAWHRQLVEGGALFADETQERAAQKLQAFADSAAADNANEGGGWARRLFGGGEKKRGGGLYLHGGVGRGKTFLMDGFYLQLQSEKKMRAHFHQFMRRFHADMKKREGEKNALWTVADTIAAKAAIVCFDEFHVADIADAMILGRLLERLLDNGVRLLMTSNYPPSGLYPNGLARDRFLPTIAMLEERLEIFCLDGGEDYRLRHLADAGEVFFHPHSEDAQRRMRDIFSALACGIALPPSVKINGRQTAALARSSDAIWFSFSQLCEEAMGQGDYLELAGRFATLLLSDIPDLSDPARSEAARRFTWLVDILYDNRVALVASGFAPLARLYGDKDGGESGRTLSRLIEMQSPAYWKKSAAD